MKKLQKTKSNKGITLVALVVTIVVLLILAGVSINLVLGENGLIAKAKEARNAVRDDNENILIGMNNLYDEMEAAIGGTTPPGDDTTKVDGVTIPVGFYYVGGTKESGLVISDDSADENKYQNQEVVGTDLTGNQFVWIPVENYDNFHLIEGYDGGSLGFSLNAESNPSREAGATESAGSPLANHSTAGTSESIAMYKSVKDNEGFYIARYEAGISGTKANSELETNNRIVADGQTKPLSKFGVGVWNVIPWGGTSSNTASDGLKGDETANGAVKVARSMYTKSETYGVTSTLCYGVQWDAIMNFIDSNYLTGNCADNSFVKNSNNQGNYTGTLSTTGYYAVKNIYDLAGNVFEWTMEACDTLYRVNRGGSYECTGSSFPASTRMGDEPNGNGDGSKQRPWFSRSFILVVLNQNVSKKT